MKTRTVFLILWLVGFLPVIPDAKTTDRELPVVSRVDLEKYTGLWHEIARYPNSFQEDCAAAVTATYTLREDGRIQVLNECLKKSGKSMSAKGSAKVADKVSNAKLRVTFFWPFYGDYWILDLGKDYEYAVVGEPKRKYLWILSRTPEMSEDAYNQILTKLPGLGYDAFRLIRTPPRL